MDNDADLTICIPAFNNNESLERALNSISGKLLKIYYRYDWKCN